MDFKIAQNQIRSRVNELAREMKEFIHQNGYKTAHFISILVGSFVFTSDLLRALSKFNLIIYTDFVSASSYQGAQSTELIFDREAIEHLELKESLVIVIDDILDTGKTLKAIRKEILNQFDPHILEFCCFLKKDKQRNAFDFDVKFVGFIIPDVFVVGYGLDYNGKFRELPYVVSFSFD
jgi:hypoxanthine phosphoribosyltransferase